MKAAVFHKLGGPEVLAIEDVAVPEIGPLDVLIRVRAVSVNRTLDIDVRTWGATWPIAFPHISGADPAGDIAKLGASVEGFKVGDRVAASFIVGCGACALCGEGYDNACAQRRLIGVHRNGSYAEYVSIPARNLVRIPDSLDYEQASAIMVIFPVAWHLLIDRGALRAGETVLIMAAGGALGMAGLQIAKLAGARVIAAAGSDWKLDRAREFGADEAVNYRTAKLSAEVRRLTGGRGVDVVFENIASEELWPESIASMVNRGRLVTCGAHGGGRVPLDMNDFYRRHLSIISAAAAPKSQIDEVYRLAGEGKLKAHIHRSFPLEQVREAHALVESRDVFGRVVLTVS
jgi:NADPH:quinone reductase-like Zn-dependent oxidoreductase